MGLLGVVVNDNEDKKLMYVLHKLDGQNCETVRIWSSKSVVKDRSSAGMRPAIGGHLIGTCFGSSAFEPVDLVSLIVPSRFFDDFDFGGMIETLL